VQDINSPPGQATAQKQLCSPELWNRFDREAALDQRPSSRQLKAELADALASEDWESRLVPLLRQPPRRLVSPLFSLLLSRNPTVKWHAVTAFGLTVPNLAESDMEAARVVMRRFMWTLTDESGGIGWGSPEAMAEIMACHPRLASEYHQIFISYLLERDCPDNFLEYAPLREGAYWGATRLAQSRADLLEPSRSILECGLLSESSSQSLGYLCLALTWLGGASSRAQDRLHQLRDSQDILTVYLDRSFHHMHLSELARQAAHSL